MACIYFDAGASDCEVEGNKFVNIDPRGIYWGPYSGWDEAEYIKREMVKYREKLAKEQRTLWQRLSLWWRAE